MPRFHDLRRAAQRRSPRFDALVGYARDHVRPAVRRVAQRLPARNRDAVVEDRSAIPVQYPSARAQRPIGIFYDELSRGVNPFSLIESCGVADVTDSTEHIADLFDRFGIVKIRRVYSPQRSQSLNDLCVDFSGLAPLDFRDVFAKKRKWGTGGAPSLNDERFWPFVADPTIKRVIEALLGPDTFEFGSAVAAHYSARGLHRDYRMLVEDESSPYSFKQPRKRIVRILHYCGLNGGALGYVPFSHDEQKFVEQGRRIGLKRPTEWFDRHRDVLTQARLQRNFVEADEIERHICWAYADPGDIIVSNSAMLHCGEYLTGPRYFFVTTYAESDSGTLPIAVNNATTSKSREFYEFLESEGFLGSRDILDAIGTAAAV